MHDDSMQRRRFGNWTTIPLAEVVATVLYLAGLTPDGHDTPKTRSG
jgi:hypothetical protein